MQFRGYKLVYRRYAHLYFMMCIDVNDNELAALEAIHLFVEILDHYFGQVTELDIVLSFHQVRTLARHALLASLQSTCWLCFRPILTAHQTILATVHRNQVAALLATHEQVISAAHLALSPRRAESDEMDRCAGVSDTGRVHLGWRDPRDEQSRDSEPVSRAQRDGNLTKCRPCL